jgi:hypothetical protein
MCKQDIGLPEDSIKLVRGVQVTVLEELRQLHQLIRLSLVGKEFLKKMSFLS